MSLARFSLEPKEMAYSAELLKKSQISILTDSLQKQQTSKDDED